MKAGSKIWTLLLATAALAVAGCTDGPGGSSGAYGSYGGSGEAGRLESTEYTSEHYQVHIVGPKLNDAIQEQTRQAALLMEKMFDIYAGLEEMPLPPGPEMPIWLHLTRREYDRQAALYDFPAGSTTGFCTIDGEVHVYYKKIGSLGPEATMMHEGFHQYCHRALHFPTPAEVFAKVPNYKRQKLTTVPLWLAEGMAMNMETGRVVRDHNGIAVAVDDIGSVNKERLAQLADIINANRCPSVRDIMNKIMGDQFTTDDYAVMWGIVFDFRMATGNAVYVREQAELERAGPEAVRAAMASAIDPTRPYPYLRWPVPLTGRFLRACRVAWGLDVPTLVEVCAVGAREPRDFDRQWNRRLTQAALAEVEKLLRDQGQTLEQWEQGWRMRMLSLHAEVRGVTYRYQEPVAEQTMKKNAAAHSARDVRQGVWR